MFFELFKIIYRWTSFIIFNRFIDHLRLFKLEHIYQRVTLHITNNQCVTERQT